MRSYVIATLATLALVGCGAPSTPDFVQKAAMSDMYEVQAGKLAADLMGIDHLLAKLLQ